MSSSPRDIKIERDSIPQHGMPEMKVNINANILKQLFNRPLQRALVYCTLCKFPHPKVHLCFCKMFAGSFPFSKDIPSCLFHFIFTHFYPFSDIAPLRWGDGWKAEKEAIYWCSKPNALKIPRLEI